MKRWYIVQVLTGYEEKAKLDLQARIAEENLGESFGGILIPEATPVEVGQEKEKIFPGYMIVEMEMTAEAKRLVLETNRISKFLGGNNPEPIADHEVSRIFEQVSGKIRPKSDAVVFVIGREVHITSGPFEGFVGIIDEIDEERERMKVMVSIFGRMTAIELGFDQVKR